MRESHIVVNTIAVFGNTSSRLLNTLHNFGFFLPSGNLSERLTMVNARVVLIKEYCPNAGHAD